MKWLKSEAYVLPEIEWSIQVIERKVVRKGFWVWDCFWSKASSLTSPIKRTAESVEKVLPVNQPSEGLTKLCTSTYNLQWINENIVWGVRKCEAKGVYSCCLNPLLTHQVVSRLVDIEIRGIQIYELKANNRWNLPNLVQLPQTPRFSFGLFSPGLYTLVHGPLSR